MNVSDDVRRAYKSDSVHKTLVIEFPELSLTVPTDEVYSESMNLYESILESESIEFVGCISSKFEIQIRNTATYQKILKDKKIVATIYTEGTEEEPIPLFIGYVDSVKKEVGKNYVKIIAYDALYKCGKIEVADWYKRLTFPTTLGVLRRSLLNHIGLDFVESDLPNDSIVIKKQYNPESLQSLAVIKSICQINGCFGIVNRYGLFEFRYLRQTLNAIYPSITLFPSNYIFPSGTNESPYGHSETFQYYRTVEHQDFEVKPVNRITIRESETDTGVTYGSGENNYIIQANMFAYKLSKSVLKKVAENIYYKIASISYYPFVSVNNGIPYAECGVDSLSFLYQDLHSGSVSSNSNDPIPMQSMDCYIFSRHLSGIQALKDSFDAKGEEYQTEFVTDVNARLRTIQSAYDSKFEDIDTQFDDINSEFDDVWEAIEGGGNFNIVSTNLIPSSPLPNTLYCIQGEIITIR